uniref:Putative short d7 salivary protein n=1 Tax=Psorophora albipes TaxID=869069 RepID=T1DIZ8_9DIPT
MKCLLLIFILAVVEYSSVNGTIFQNCIIEVGNIDRKTECTLEKFHFDENVPHVRDIVKCVLTGLEYYNPNNRNLNQDRLLQEMKEKAGFSENAELTRVVEDCKSHNGSEAEAYEYFMCLLNDEKTNSSFKKLLTSKDKNFFTKTVC